MATYRLSAAESWADGNQFLQYCRCVAQAVSQLLAQCKEGEMFAVHEGFKGAHKQPTAGFRRLRGVVEAAAWRQQLRAHPWRRCAHFKGCAMMRPCAPAAPHPWTARRPPHRVPLAPGRRAAA